MRWIPATAEHRNAVAAGRHPVKETRPLRFGEEKRLLKRLGAGDTTEAALERARAMPWWKRRTTRKPSCDARWWIFIVRVA